MSLKNVNDLGNFTKLRGWNELTKMCYARCCVCRGCENEHISIDGLRCQVKASVLESVRVFGVPFERSKVVMGE